MFKRRSRVPTVSTSNVVWTTLKREGELEPTVKPTDLTGQAFVCWLSHTGSTLRLRVVKRLTNEILVEVDVIAGENVVGIAQDEDGETWRRVALPVHDDTPGVYVLQLCTVGKTWVRDLTTMSTGGI